MLHILILIWNIMFLVYLYKIRGKLYGLSHFEQFLILLGVYGIWPYLFYIEVRDNI